MSDGAAARRIEVARELFEAWSSGDADAPAAYLAPDAVLHDIVGGTKRGWPEIRAFFAEGLVQWPDLTIVPEEYWANERGVALRWVMRATVADERFGPDRQGRTWASDGMTYLYFDDADRVVYEVDYHHGPNVARSLGIGG